MKKIIFSLDYFSRYLMKKRVKRYFLLKIDDWLKSAWFHNNKNKFDFNMY